MSGLAATPKPLLVRRPCQTCGVVFLVRFKRGCTNRRYCRKCSAAKAWNYLCHVSPNERDSQL